MLTDVFTKDVIVAVPYLSLTSTTKGLNEKMLKMLVYRTMEEAVLK